MGALTRVAMDWLDRLVKFHQILSGSAIEKYPKIDDAGNVLIYYSLHKLVTSLGGFEKVSSQNLWSDVAAKLKLSQFGSDKARPIGDVLRTTYSTVILPFEQFLEFMEYAGVSNGDCQYKNCNLQATKKAFKKRNRLKHVKQHQVHLVSPKMETGKSADYQPIKSEPDLRRAPDTPVSPPQTPFTERLRKRRFSSTVFKNEDGSDFDEYFSEDDPQLSDEYSNLSKKYKRRSRSEAKKDTASPAAENSVPARRRSSRTKKAVNLNEDNSEKESVQKNQMIINENEEEQDVVTICEVCENTCLATHSGTISCSECEGLFHTYCISNSEVFLPPSGHAATDSAKNSTSSWYCSRCLVGSCEFAFEPGKTYTLGDFQDVADDFKLDYLEKNPQLSNLDKEEFETEIEKRFWNYVNTSGKSITVEYGSDIHCNEKGSGFPVRAKDPYNKYSRDPWNLNNMPHHRDSLFHQISSDISGMTVPWLYVGMMFSTFCWHSEDHYTYSVNYQHFGETKTWYGIPGADAEKFEAAMRDTVPDLFEKQPNLLFQLVTMLSPEVLVEKGVRCYAIDQGPGEFVITFPKAYHAGFNHGFNCNEAVNFAPPDWLPFGQESVETYREYNRAPVFSHDSLVLRTARLDKREETARWLLPHVEALVSREIATRKDIVDKLQKLHVAGRSGTEARSAPNSVNCVAVPKLVTAEPASEEEYQCCICNSLPYLSKVVIRKRKPVPHHQQSGPGRRRKVAEQQLYDDGEDDDDLMELVFGRPGSGGLDDPETADAAGDDQLPTRPIDRLTVCSRHIPETVPACVYLDYEIHCTEQELLSLRDELSNRINHSHLPS